MKHLILLLALCSISHAQIMPGARRAASVLPVTEDGECTLLVEQTLEPVFIEITSGGLSQKLKLASGTIVCKIELKVRNAGGDVVSMELSSDRSGGGTEYGTVSGVALSSVGWQVFEFDPPVEVGTDPWFWVYRTSSVGATRVFYDGSGGNAYEDTDYFVYASGNYTTWDMTFKLHTVQ